MSAVLVYVQHNEGKVLKATLVAITAAKELLKAWQGSVLVGVAVGPGAAAAAAEVGVYGVSQVATVEGSDYQAFRAVPYSAAVQAAVAKFQAATVVFASTSVGKDIAPRIAADLNAGQATDIVAVHPDGSLRRPMYAGNAFADVEVVTPVRVVTVRTTAFAAAVAASGSATVVPLQVSFDPAIAGEFVSAEISKGGRPELSDAAMVVSGGRALQSAENFEKVLFPLADALGAAVGASRAAVDSGYAPNDWQVGQTGKVVAPSLYIACGISGAIQHLAGMKDSKTIVAINKDPEAPIFEVADFGLVADLFQAVPELTAAVRTLKGGA